MQNAELQQQKVNQFNPEKTLDTEETD